MHINTKSDKIDNLIKERDIIDVFSIFSYLGSNLLEFTIRGQTEILSAKSNKFLNTISGWLKVKEHRLAVVEVVIKTHPVSKRKYITFNGIYHYCDRKLWEFFENLC